jgi:hypothetical protein
MSEPVQANLQRAMQLVSEGRDNEATRQETGWFKGMDGRWRYEIPDLRRNIKFDNIPSDPKSVDLSVPLKEIYDNKDLYAAYPQLAALGVRRHFPEFEGVASYNGVYYKTSEYASPIIVISFENSSDPKSTLIHEVQHAIQEIEGFAEGTNPSTGHASQETENATDALVDRIDVMVKDLPRKPRQDYHEYLEHFNFENTHNS